MICSKCKKDGAVKMFINKFGKQCKTCQDCRDLVEHCMFLFFFSSMKKK